MTKRRREATESEVSDGSRRWALPLHFPNCGSEIRFRGGAEGAIPIAARFLKSALGADGWAGFETPERIVSEEIDPATGLLAARWCDAAPEVFLLGTKPTQRCPRPQRWWRWW